MGIMAWFDSFSFLVWTVIATASIWGLGILGKVCMESCRGDGGRGKLMYVHVKSAFPDGV